MEWLIVIGLVWVLPIFVAKQIGDGKNRAGIAYGVLLGWIGVIVLLMMPPLRDDEEQPLDRIEQLRELADLHHSGVLNDDEFERAIRTLLDA